MVHGRTLLAAVVVLACGCAPRLDLGSDLIFAARHENGDLGEWTLAGEGGSAADPPVSNVKLTTEVAHTGRYAVKLTNAATGDYDTARVWRQGNFAQDAYYSVWFLLPQANRTTANWTILQFRHPTAQDPTVISQLLDLDLRSLPGGELIVTVFDHRGDYLRSPTPEVATPVPIGTWFQLEVRFRNVADDTGRFTVWLDGELLYDLHRPIGLNSTVWFSPCNSSEDLSPLDSIVYVDDAAISFTRLTPDATL